MKYFWCYNY